MNPEAIQAVIGNMRASTKFVAPASPAQLGWYAYEAGLAETDVPVEARRGWRAANRAESFAVGNAYLISQGAAQ